MPLVAGAPVRLLRPSPPAVSLWTGVRRVLAVRLDNLGDLLMTTPALAAMRGAWPDAHLALLASEGGSRLAPHLPMVDEVIPFDAPWMKCGGHAEGADAERLHHLVARLAAGRFDAAIVFTVCTQSALPMALLALQAGIGRRLAHCRENPYGLLTDWVNDPDRPPGPLRHEVQRQLDLVAHVGCAEAAHTLHIALAPEDRAAARDRLREAGADLRRPYVVLHPGATAPSRRYPPERLGEAAAALAAAGVQLVFAGAAGDAAAVDAARGAVRAPSIDLCGRLPLGALAALIEGASCVVCNNSAPAHLAAATGTPVVVLYALTNPQHTPWAVEARVLSHPVPCRDCLRSVCPQGHHDCLRRIEPAEVAAAALALMHRCSGAAPVPQPRPEAAALAALDA